MSPEDMVEYICERQQMAEQSGAFRRWVEHHVDGQDFALDAVHVEDINEDISHLNSGDADLRKGPPVLYEKDDGIKVIDGRHRVKWFMDHGIEWIVAWMPI